MRAWLLVLVVASCGGGKRDDQPAPVAHAGSAVAYPADEPDGIVLALGDGPQGAPAFDRARLAPATKLDDSRTAALLARLKPLVPDAADTRPAALRPASQPPPLTGQTIAAAFPPPPSSAKPPVVATTPLRVVRWTPEGEVPNVPQLTVTFDQPMVAVGAQAAAAVTQPVKLAPQPKGAWRWIGARTIVFDPEGGAFPKATTYMVTIPAGTKGIAGAPLAADVSFSFETPAPTPAQQDPYDGATIRRDETMQFVFDQRVDPARVLAAVHATATPPRDPKDPWTEKKLPIALELTKPKQPLDKDEEGRTLVVRPVQPMPANADIELVFGPGVPSREGPNATKTAVVKKFRTYAPLAFVTINCYGACRPGRGFRIEYTNDLDLAAVDPQLVTIDPPIKDARVSFAGRTIDIDAATRPRTTYKVHVPRALKDEYGQTLAADEIHEVAIGDAEADLRGASGTVVVDPNAPPRLAYYTTNYTGLKVKLYPVGPSDYAAFSRGAWNDAAHAPPVAALPVANVATTAGPNLLSETFVDLAPALHAGHGHVVAVVEPEPWTDPKRPAPRYIAWAQATQLAIDAYVDREQLVGFVTQLATGAPVAGATVTLYPSGVAATTDAQGLVTIALPKGANDAPHYVTAHKGDDTTILDGGELYAHPPADEPTWHVVSDRDLYRPGERVSIAGWVRFVDDRRGGDVGGVDGRITSVSYRVTDSEDRPLATGQAKLDALGAFALQFAVPATPNLGTATITLTANGTVHGTTTSEIRIEEFRRPEFTVAAHPPDKPVIVGTPGDVGVEASYFAGGPLGGAPVNWRVSAAQTTYRPPNRDDYVFGVWTPRWHRRDYHRPSRTRREAQHKEFWQFDGKTDVSGAHQLRIAATDVRPQLPYTISAEASVTDENHQAYSADTTFVLHPAALYVGVKTQKPFVQQGQPYELALIGVDLDGKLVAGAQVAVDTVRLDAKFEHGEWVQEELEPQHCAVVTATAPATCSLATPKPGRYNVRARITDPQGRVNLTSLDFWVAGAAPDPPHDVARQDVTIIPDKQHYTAGNTAELLVQSPFVPAEGVVTWRRSGIVHTQRITMTKGTQVITVPITDAMVPNLYVQVDLVGAVARVPAYASGRIELDVPPKQRTLAVEVKPAADKIAPGAATSVGVVVRDAAGAPVPNAEVTLFVVDDAILTLANYTIGDPIETFYTNRDEATRDFYSRSYISLADASTIGTGRYGTIGHGSGTGSGYGVGSGRGGFKAKSVTVIDSVQEMPDPDAPSGGGGLKLVIKHKVPAEPPKAIAVRSNFDPLASFTPAIVTGADGSATVPFTMPDSVTRYRVIAIAAAGARQFGKGESTLTARLPLMVRPSPPRFLSYGDTFQFPVTIQNQTDAPMQVDVAIAATNLALTDGAGRAVTVPPNDRVLVEFPAAAREAGTARFQLAAAAGKLSDAAEQSLPVWTPATTEAFATYGVIDAGAIRQQVTLPANILPTYGELDVSTASTNLQALTDALLYIVHYPYECSEQRSSRVLAIAGLRDVLGAFHTSDMPSAAALAHSMTVDIAAIAKLQNDDGGFGFWRSGEDSNPYVSVFVVHAMAMAKAKGYAVPAELFTRAKDYLAKIDEEIPAGWGPAAKRAVEAFAVFVRMELGDVDVARATELAADPKSLTVETAGWLLATLAKAPAETTRKALVRFAYDHVTETAGAATFVDAGYGEDIYALLGSPVRSSGVMLDALIRAQPDSDLIPKLVAGLLASRRAGKWESTQDNVFVLGALDRYFHTYEKTTPSFIARVWLGADFAGEHAFRGRTTETHQIAIGMPDVATHDRRDIVIDKDGGGRLYYRIGMTYAPADLHVAPADHGFVVERTYVGLDDPKDVTRTSDGTWHVKVGARVRVKLSMAIEGERHHVALVDPLPAGFEPLDPQFAATGAIPLDPSEHTDKYWWWSSTWYEHQNLRDNRAEAFAAEVWPGVHAYEYSVRATTRGTFVAGPTKAEEMYMPETFGRGASERVIVE